VYMTRPNGDLSRHSESPSRRTSRTSINSYRLSPTHFGMTQVPESELFEDAASVLRPASADLETSWGRLQQQQQQQQQGSSPVAAKISKRALESFHSTHSLRDLGGSSNKSHGNSDRRSFASGISSHSAWTIGTSRHAKAPSDTAFAGEFSRTYVSADESRGNVRGETVAAHPDSKSTFGGSSTAMFGSASDVTETPSKAAARGGLKGILRSMWRVRA
jgi:hypothetical protein